MATVIEKLKSLEIMLGSEGELGLVFAFFLDNLGNDTDFMRCGKPAKNTNLKIIIQKLCEGMLERDCQITGMKLFHVPKSQFYHGLCQAGGKSAFFFYFEHIEMGMVAINVGPAFGQCTYARFNATFGPADRSANFVAPRKKSIQ